jgi:hypothetical protein
MLVAAWRGVAFYRVPSVGRPLSCRGRPLTASVHPGSRLDGIINANVSFAHKFLVEISCIYKITKFM